MDIVTSGVSGKGFDAVCKFELLDSSKTVYKTIHVLVTSINETVKEISNLINYTN